MVKNDASFMRLALNQAAKGRYQTWKNPMVGSVIVKHGQVLATGYHHHYGDQHAERNAISKLTPEQLFNSTLYVTLEPCNHYGKQPPCSELIIKSHIKRVVIAQVDPHKLVTGKGITNLKQHGIEVEVGVLAEEARKLNEHYSYFYENDQPWITLKQAISLDHKVTAIKGTRTQITNQEVYQRVHSERADYQAIVIGSSTAIIDNPSLLTSHQSNFPPIRIILDRRGRLLDHLDLKLLTDNLAPTWIFTQNQELAFHPFNNSVHCFLNKGNILVNLLTELKKQEIQSIYVEGGPKIENAFLNQFQVNELITYLSPDLIGQDGLDGLSPQFRQQFTNKNFEILADNIRIDERN
ncbi:diaminohydroxyphosphoribosylaminopyrimidine deaminase/5-amino-6-(5-phosphoribosylamino)uracil reductase [Lactobacillus colini]|uniref:Riboflavin biosynthesis protein RibD n=1 Tax=Lactobacillus colini TaxID=1819254 RepID=A0ABS4MCX9_9LACO|nr:bifunctional diaminohydroxyphosphoribosylaminopyrimidine deaminase/5-amino-6-(5-phosphoribosylamino)uracil reductase RibD [Lactobacillus colini]MBP2057524.1 diaminohydroxyphosphoribosylaminopyrimidine deaminase/5-amino-6-(5-phosphoribosylamino)uracil reductase [Lactobacillus colini]